LNGYSMGFIILYCVIFLVCIVFNKMVFPHYPYMLSGLFMIGQFVLMALMASAYMDQGSAIVMIIVFLIAVLKFSYDMQARGMG
jgi:thiol:disulfide interchange protein